MLGSSSSFLETSKVMPVVEYKTSVFLKVGSCTMKYSFSRFLTKCQLPPPPHPHQILHNDFSYSRPSSKLPELLTALWTRLQDSICIYSAFPLLRCFLDLIIRWYPLRSDTFHYAPPNLYCDPSQGTKICSHDYQGKPLNERI